MVPPVLRTDRLTLDAHVVDDLPDCVAMWEDPAVYGMIGGRAFTREETWHRLQRHAGHWMLHPYGSWAIRETATGCYAGSAGLMDSRRDTTPSFEGTPEAGWALASWAHGRGYAREALAAILAWADERHLPRTVCIIDPANTRSIRLAEELGYQRMAEARYRDAPILLFERTPSS